jgi:hypothetical protein
LFLGLGAGATAYNLLSDNEKEDQKSSSGQLPLEKKLTTSISPEKTSTDNVPPTTPSSNVVTPSGADVSQDLQKSQESLLDAFKKAREEDKKSQAMAMLQMGASDVLRGGLGASYKVALPEASNKFWEEQAKSSDAMKAFLANQEMQKDDPNSPISKRMREIARPMLKKLNITLPDNMSYSEIKENFPQFTKMYDVEVMSQQHEKEKELARQEKRKQESTLSDKQTDTITKLDNALSVINDIQTSKEEFDTGPISNIQSKIAGTVGIDTPEKTAFRSKVGDQLAQYLHDLSGAAITPQEYSRLVQNLPTAADNDETFNAKLQALKERVEMQKRNSLSNFEKQGKDVEKWKDSMQTNEPSTDTLIDKKTGKKYLVDHSTKKVIKEIQ